MDNETRFKIIERFDSYYSGINNKGAFLLSFNTFLIGAFIVGYKDILGLVACANKCQFNLLIGSLLLLSIISMVLTIISIIPFLKPSIKNDKKSNWFFKDVAIDKKQDFFDRINNSSPEEQETDLNNQIYVLAKGLRMKYLLIKLALILNLIGIVVLIPIIYLILK